MSAGNIEQRRREDRKRTLRENWKEEGKLKEEREENLKVEGMASMWVLPIGTNVWAD